MKKMLLLTILLIPLMLIGTQIAYGGANPVPPGPDERLVGPVTDGILGIAYVGTDPTGTTDMLFWGTCNNLPVKINLFNFGPDFFSSLTEQTLLYQRFTPEPGKPFCNTSHGVEQLIIVGVKKFYKSEYGSHLIAEITLMFIEYKK